MSDTFLIVAPSGYVVGVRYSEDEAKKAVTYYESLADYGYKDLAVYKIVKTEMVQ